MHIHIEKHLTAILLICMCVLFAGCTQNRILIHHVCQDYLESRGAKSSKAVSVDFSYFETYEQSVPALDYWYIYNNADELLPIYGSFADSGKKDVSEGDFVEILISITNAAGEKKFTGKRCIFPVGLNKFNREAEEKLIGASVGDTVDAVLSLDGLGADWRYEGGSIRMNISAVLEYRVYPATQSIVEGKTSRTVQEFYAELFDIKRSEAESEQTYRKRKRFFEPGFDHCDFNLAEEDVINEAQMLLEAYKKEAESLQMSLEKYIEWLEIGEDVFFQQIEEDSEYNIKRCLLVGALASAFHIELTESDMAHFCELNHIQDTETEQVKYECLTGLVLNRFGIR